MRTQDQSERRLHRCHIERPADVPRVARHHRVRRLARLDAIEIRLRCRAVTCREFAVGLPCVLDDDVVRQQTVHRPRDTLCRDRAVRKKIHDLSIGMDARIRAAGRRKFNAIAEDDVQLFFEHVLHGDNRRRLPLEARVGRAVIGDGERNVAPPRLHQFFVFFLHIRSFR